MSGHWSPPSTQLLHLQELQVAHHDAVLACALGKTLAQIALAARQPPEIVQPWVQVTSLEVLAHNCSWSSWPAKCGCCAIQRIADTVSLQ